MTIKNTNSRQIFLLILIFVGDIYLSLSAFYLAQAWQNRTFLKEDYLIHIDFKFLFLSHATDSRYFPFLFIPLMIIIWNICLAILHEYHHNSLSDGGSVLTTTNLSHIIDNLIFAISFSLLSAITIDFFSIGLSRKLLIYYVICSVILIFIYHCFITLIVYLISSEIYLLRNIKAKYILSFFAIGLGFYMSVSIYLFGVEFENDGMHYMHHAIYMNHTMRFDVSPQVAYIAKHPNPLWAPLHPFLISLGMFVHPFPADSAGFMSGIYSIFYFFAFAHILQNFNTSLKFNLICLMTLFTIPAISNIFHSVFSEPPFALFLIITLYYLSKHSQTYQLGDYFFIILFATSASLTRYIGYVLLISVSIYTSYFLIMHRNHPLISKSKHLVLNILSYVPILSYEIYTYITLGTFHGIRNEPTSTVADEFNLLIDVLTHDLNQYILLLAVLALILYIFQLKQQKYIVEKKIIIFLTFIFLFICFYLLTFFYIYSTINIDIIQSRYLAPLYSYLLLFVVIIHISILNIQHGNSNIIKIGFYTFLVVAIFTNIQTFRNKLTSKPGLAPRYNHANFHETTVGKQFNAYFKKSLTSHDKILVSVINWKGAIATPIFGRSFFFKKNMIDNPSYQNITLSHVQTNGFSISLESNQQEKMIIYRDFPALTHFDEKENELIYYNINSAIYDQRVVFIFYCEYEKFKANYRLPIQGYDYLKDSLYEMAHSEDSTLAILIIYDPSGVIYENYLLQENTYYGVSKERFGLYTIYQFEVLK